MPHMYICLTHAHVCTMYIAILLYSIGFGSWYIVHFCINLESNIFNLERFTVWCAETVAGLATP